MWVKSVATSIKELKEGDMLVRAKTFYFLMLNLIALRMHIISKECALELLRFVVSMISSST